MESEMKEVSSKDQILEPIEGSVKDDRPLLKSESNSDQSSSTTTESILELEKKYAAYVRNDVYGTMGRGELPLTEKLLLGFALVSIVPIRIIIGMNLLFFYYFICRFCTLFSVPNRDEGDDEEEEQEDYAHMVGWRRSIIVNYGRFLARVMLFNMGVYWISESYRELLAAESPETESEELERPGTIISNHVSYLDILYHTYSFFPSFVAKLKYLTTL
ncbi:lysophospholipid acyltransferase LPEAT1-like [Papaver somniferum]|uniref:lysophospholipid acyltransferase LPEAT1-like n=1 Tax=Papaver somniferum TaxID=3469 RepID=UPI000E6F5FEB|nr:lysophospholipid acyltransferase LPEAT1-like [Papaver somniferum]